MSYYRDTPPHYDDPETPEEIAILEDAIAYVAKNNAIDEENYPGEAIDTLEEARNMVVVDYECAGCGLLMDEKGKYCSKRCYQEQHEDEGKER